MSTNFAKIPEDTFKEIQMNAGILVGNFDPTDGTVTDILGATTGGITITATPTFIDMGEDVDNCPKNMMELKKLDSWDITMSGTYVTVSADIAKSLLGAAKVSTSDNKITPKSVLEPTDFKDIWWIGDYSDVNTGDNAGFVAAHMKSALSTGGFQIKSTDKNKGQFAFTYTAHYSIADPDDVPFEVYVKPGTASSEP